MKIGLVADIHGDLSAFKIALEIFEEQQIDRLICAGDIVDRGPDADRIVALLKQHRALCIKGNHEYTVLQQQERWRASERRERLAEVGRIISDSTAAFIEELPDTDVLTCEGIRLLIAHGVPWSDVLGLFPDSRPSRFRMLADRIAQETNIVILGHTHQPMDVRVDLLRIINPGSVYGITIRDSHTCAVLSLPDGAFEVYELRHREQVEVPVLVIPQDE